MNYGPLIFLGVFFTVAASWLGVVLGPHLQFGNDGPATTEDTGITYPYARPGQAHQGAEVYRANGCFYCHTRQVRSKEYGSDLERHWGKRRTVARDFLWDQPLMLGTLRLGPDLANIGARETNTHALLLRLYNPRSVMPNSTMPRYPYLFEKRPIKPGQEASPDAVFVDQSSSDRNIEIVPKPEAYQLVAYLQSQKAEAVILEVLPPLPPGGATNVVSPGGTNAAIATPATNAPATNAPSAK